MASRAPKTGLAMRNMVRRDELSFHHSMLYILVAPYRLTPRIDHQMR